MSGSFTSFIGADISAHFQTEVRGCRAGFAIMSCIPCGEGADAALRPFIGILYHGGPAGATARRNHSRQRASRWDPARLS